MYNAKTTVTLLSIVLLMGCNSVSEDSNQLENRLEHGQYSESDYEEIMTNLNYVFIQAGQSFQRTKTHLAQQEVDSIRAVDKYANWSEIPQELGNQLIDAFGKFVEVRNDGPDEFVTLPIKVELHYITELDGKRQIALSIRVFDDQTMCIDGVTAKTQDLAACSLLKEVLDSAAKVLEENPHQKENGRKEE